MIILKGKDGSVAVMTLAPGANEADALKKFHECHPGLYLKKGVKNVELPEDRQFRDAWVHSGDKVVVDGSKAKAIHLDRIRLKRDRALEALDKEQLRHLKDDAKLLEIEEKKQELRELPQNIKGLDWPDILEK